MKQMVCEFILINKVMICHLLLLLLLLLFTGVLLVYNPDAPAQDQQIGDWFEFFVKKNNLSDQQCMVFAHRQASSKNLSNQKIRPREDCCCCC